ncbi:MAG TPA: hypothetical protein VHX65_01495 [Pirellulales bacterium]|jgi:hypothetical protein|nr:hypothetical protein [Pirellulales bacterium]
MGQKPDRQVYDSVADRVICKRDRVWDLDAMPDDAPISRAKFAVEWERLTADGRDVFNCLVDAGRTTSFASLASVYGDQLESLSPGILERLVESGLVRKKFLYLSLLTTLHWYEPSEVEERYAIESKPADAQSDSFVVFLGDCLFAVI